MGGGASKGHASSVAIKESFERSSKLEQVRSSVIACDHEVLRCYEKGGAALRAREARAGAAAD